MTTATTATAAAAALDAVRAVDAVVLTGARPAPPVDLVVVRAETPGQLEAYHRLRHDTFVVDQGLFVASDRDEVDDDDRCVVLLALTGDGTVLGGVRIHPALPAAPDLGWWRGSRLVVAPGARSATGVAPALIRAACAEAEARGALRFEATVQRRHRDLFAGLGWRIGEHLDLHGLPHVRADWPIARIQRLVDATKAALGGLVSGLLDVAPGFLGDDGAPVPGTDLVAACDAIVPAMVERDPEWAGWCSVLVNVNDLSAMGAAPTALLDAVGARDASFARRVLTGVAAAARAWGVPVVGGHTQLGVPAALAVTALGRTAHPVRGGGASAGESLRVTADLGGGWRPRYTGAQWDSTSHRTPEQLRALTHVVPDLRPTAAKDVSMSGLVGTTGMLAEASGCRAVLDVARIPAPADALTADWLTCFPGFAMVTAHADTTADPPDAVGWRDLVTSTVCGRLEAGTGVGLRWPDGVVTEAVTAGVTHLGAA